MTVIELPDDQAAALKARAAAQGLTLEAWLKKLADIEGAVGRSSARKGRYSLAMPPPLAVRRKAWSAATFTTWI
jgi:hypothetical protein